jgi:hypothetical protein
MIRLLLKSGLLGLLLLSSGGLLWWRINQVRALEYQNSYYAAIADKNVRLQAVKQPKIILVGGSNLTFGIDSPTIERVFGRPVVNMSLNAGLGIQFMLNEAKSGLRPGDVVVLCPEYYLREGSEYTQHYVADLYPPARSYIRYHSTQDSLEKNWSALIQKIRNGLFLAPNTEVFGHIEDQTSIYFRRGFNAQGDLVSHLDNPAPLHYGASVRYEVLDYSWPIVEMNKFVAYAQQQGAQVYFSYPCLARTEFEHNRAAIRAYEEQLAQRLVVKPIDHPEDYAYADSCFYDTAHHLRGQARMQRTRTLIEHLSPYLTATK